MARKKYDGRLEDVAEGRVALLKQLAPEDEEL
jgi:hypothetical protein